MKNAVKLIIEIPKEFYEVSRAIEAEYGAYDLSHLTRAMAHGTLLPKKHGRLIDADELYDSLIFPTEQFAKGFKELLDDAPTVIEADEVGK